jgi:hypothetical protein
MLRHASWREACHVTAVSDPVVLRISHLPQLTRVKRNTRFRRVALWRGLKFNRKIILEICTSNANMIRIKKIDFAEEWSLLRHYILATRLLKWVCGSEVRREKK